MATVMNFPRREAQALGLVGLAHFLSHVFTLAMAPLLPLITRDIGISYTEFGIVLAAFAITTGVFQTPMGLLVERIGGRPVLIAGLTLNAACFVLVGLFADNLWVLIALMALAGVGNSVFHPADYSLLSSSIDGKRVGQAYSVHTFLGIGGLVVGPILTAALEPSVGWRGAVMAVGAFGLATALVLLVFANLITEGTKVKKPQGIGDSLRELLSSPTVLLFFLFYMCTSAANVGITQFSVVALEGMYSVERVTAVMALTAYQIGALMLVLPGGVLADKTTRYDLILVLGFGITAILVFLAGTGAFPFWLAVSMLCVGGALRGGVNAARDVAVRNIPVDIPIGTVFGFISTGFLVGQAIGGPFYGWLFDTYPPNYVFYVSAAVHLVGIGIIMINPGARKRVVAPE